MKKNWLLWGAVAVGAYLLWRKMSNRTEGTGATAREIVPNPTPVASESSKETMLQSENSITEEGL